jgi:hypothetical protein
MSFMLLPDGNVAEIRQGRIMAKTDPRYLKWLAVGNTPLESTIPENLKTHWETFKASAAFQNYVALTPDEAATFAAANAATFRDFTARFLNFIARKANV